MVNYEEFAIRVGKIQEVNNLVSVPNSINNSGHVLKNKEWPYNLR